MASPEDAETLRPVLERLVELVARSIRYEALLLGIEECPGLLPETVQGLWRSIGAMSFEARNEDEEMAVADAVESAAAVVPDVVGVLGEVLEYAVESRPQVDGAPSAEASCLASRLEAFDMWGDHAEMLDEMLSGMEMDITTLRADGDPELEGDIAAMEQELERTRQTADFVWAALARLGDRSSSVASLEELARQLRTHPFEEGEEPTELYEVIAQVREACAGPMR